MAQSDREQDRQELVWGEGPVPCVGMIIGEAPGAEEEKLGRPFVGASGRLLNEALEAAGAKRENFYITNVYKTRPPANRTPTDDELNDHFLYLDDEFRDVDPRKVLLLGGTAAREFYGDEYGGITRRRGKWEGLLEGPHYLATFHPSYVLRGKGREEFFADVKEFVYACLQQVREDAAVS